MASLTYLQASKLAALLNIADPKKSMYVHILSATRLALGADPLNPSAVIDFSKEAIVPYMEAKVAGPQHPAGASPNMRDTISVRATRRSGGYWYELKGKRTDCQSLKELLALALLSIEKAVPGTLNNLTKVKPRSRRIVARDPKDLFDKPHLAKDYAEKLGKDGWYYGTNNSANETGAWLRRACAHAGLKWGEDFKTSLAPGLEAVLADI
jgi:hypothetical protein